MFAGLITIAGGILAASALIIARKPNAKELINKLTPYQGWIGIVMFFWGVWAVIDCTTHLSFLKVAPLFWTFWLASGVADLLVGFLLGFGAHHEVRVVEEPGGRSARHRDPREARAVSRHVWPVRDRDGCAVHRLAVRRLS